MQIHTLDLGIIDQPLLVFGGPYGNIHALDALLDTAKSLQIEPSHMLCTGDLVAYCAHPAAVIDRVRELEIPVVAGNTEQSLSQDAKDCGCGFEQGSSCDLLSKHWYAYAQHSLDDERKQWLGSFPTSIKFKISGYSFTAIHGGLSDISRFIFASTPDDIKRAELKLAGSDAIVAGHCGIPFTQNLGQQLWHNAGVIGLPANDNTHRVWYSLLHPLCDGVRIEQRALIYDYLGAAHAMREQQLPKGYASCLEKGLWPSLEVLPESERQATGLALSEQSFSWTPQSTYTPS